MKNFKKFPLFVEDRYRLLIRMESILVFHELFFTLVSFGWLVGCLGFMAYQPL